MSQRFPRLAASLVVALLVAGYFTREDWLPSAAERLIQDDPLETADVVVALAGDPSGVRIRKALELVEQGYARLALADVTGYYYGRSQCEIVEEYIQSIGASADQAEVFCFKAESTLAESSLVDEELRRRGMKSAIIVTSDYHTRRAARIFRLTTSGEVAYRFAASRSDDFDPQIWWKDREMRATVGLEYLKTIHSWLESLY